jgi:hypothetical protein
MRKFILSFAASMLLVMGVGSCQSVRDFFGGDDLVVTTPDMVVDGSDAALIPVDSLPDKVRKLIPDGMEVVVAPKSDLVSEDAQHIPLMGEFNDTAIGTAVNAAIQIGKTMVPGLAGWEALLLLLFKRKRQHYGRAFKALVPIDKNVDLGGAVAGVSAALGLTHSSEGSQATFEEELEEEEA